MHRESKRLAALNVVGGIAVLGSYGLTLAQHQDAGVALWGGVPSAWQPLYRVSMLCATAGYFAFAQHLLLRVDPATVRFGPWRHRACEVIFALILGPSAVWMPLTFAYLAAPSTALWVAVRAVLAVVGLASLALVFALWRMQQKTPTTSWRLALLGSVLFAFQTAGLDALVWTHFFNQPPQ